MSRRLTFPLFWRIFLTIWLAMAVAVVASNMVTRYLMDRERETIERQVGLQDLAREAVDIRERLGRVETWRFLRREGERRDLHLLLIERDLDLGRLPKSVRERMNSFWHPQKPAVIDLPGGRYRLVAWPRMHSKGWLDPRFFQAIESGLAFLLISLACWWIARWVSRPLRHMESTARSIAQGDNTLRVNARIAGRRDEIGQLAQAFNAMTDQLCRLLERQNQLLRDISHDLRTPLARQRVAIELACDSGADPELMTSILRQNERLETMTGQILTLYRVTEQGQDIQRQPVQPLVLVNRALQEVADYAEHQGVDCRLVAEPEVRGATLLGDEGLLHRAIDNVLQNALDHTPPGKVVRVSLALQGEDCVVTVEDQGPGVDDRLLAHLFEPFFRADPSRGGNGWGLGLAIARNIVSAHDGTIAAENRPEGGLRVTLRLPLLASG
jgi:signal transduction histidine kinase